MIIIYRISNDTLCILWESFLPRVKANIVAPKRAST